jgi:hypothetical protein
MKMHHILRAVLGVAASVGAAGAMAQTGLTSSPASLAFSIGGGLSQFKTVTITNGGPGFASNVVVLLSGNGGPPHDDVYIVGDTCSGATLANGGTCTVRLGFDSQCPLSWFSSWNLNLSATGVTGVHVPITATSRGGVCQ